MLRLKLKIHKKQTILLLAVIVIACAVIPPTVAWLFSETGPLTNLFNQSELSCEVIQPTADDGCYQIKNTGETKIYVRVAVTANWTRTDADGIVHVYYAGDPTVTVALSDTDQWQQVGNYYYCVAPIDAGDTLDFAAVTADATVTAPSDDYADVSVHVSAEAIQTTPSEAIEEAWGLQLVDGTWETTGS